MANEHETNGLMVELPLGQSNSSMISNELRALLRTGELSILIRRYSEAAFEIELEHNRVPTARSGLMDYTEKYAGLIGDAIRIRFGAKMQIVGYEKGVLTLRFWEKF